MIKIDPNHYVSLAMAKRLFDLKITEHDPQWVYPVIWIEVDGIYELCYFGEIYEMDILEGYNWETAIPAPSFMEIMDRLSQGTGVKPGLYKGKGIYYCENLPLIVEANTAPDAAGEMMFEEKKLEKELALLEKARKEVEGKIDEQR